MTRHPEGNRNALLALHFQEGDPRARSEARAHAAACEECREYLAVLSQVEDVLRVWTDEEPPPGLGDRVLAQALRSARQPPLPRPASDAMPLLGLLPVMAVLVAAIRSVAAWLSGFSVWTFLEDWPALQALVPVGAATVGLLALGALGTLALAPALVMESGGRPRWQARALGLRG